MLRAYNLQGQTDWVKNYPIIELHYDAMDSSSTGKAPFEAVYIGEA